MNEEQFLKEHPSLPKPKPQFGWFNIANGQADCYYYASDIHKTQLDKQKVREAKVRLYDALYNRLAGGYVFTSELLKSVREHMDKDYAEFEKELGVEE